MWVIRWKHKGQSFTALALTLLEAQTYRDNLTREGVDGYKVIIEEELDVLPGS